MRKFEAMFLTSVMKWGSVMIMWLAYCAIMDRV